jgi:hypothetical protein
MCEGDDVSMPRNPSKNRLKASSAQKSSSVSTWHNRPGEDQVRRLKRLGLTRLLVQGGLCPGYRRRDTESAPISAGLIPFPDVIKVRFTSMDSRPSAQLSKSSANLGSVSTSIPSEWALCKALKIAAVLRTVASF